MGDLNRRMNAAERRAIEFGDATVNETDLRHNMSGWPVLANQVRPIPSWVDWHFRMPGSRDHGITHISVFGQDGKEYFRML